VAAIGRAYNKDTEENRGYKRRLRPADEVTDPATNGRARLRDVVRV
jgi:hypothetical protein